MWRRSAERLLVDVPIPSVETVGVGFWELSARGCVGSLLTSGDGVAIIPPNATGNACGLGGEKGRGAPTFAPMRGFHVVVGWKSIRDRRRRSSVIGWTIVDSEPDGAGLGSTDPGSGNA